jgi:Nif-specific regulatory protein
MADELYLSEKDLSLFGEVIASFHTISDLDEMLATIFLKIRSIFDIEGSSIALHDPANKEFYFFRTIEVNKEPGKLGIPLLTFPDHKGIAGWVMEQNKAVLINDVQGDERVYNRYDMQKDFVTKSMICVPLRTRKGFLGVLYALNKISGDFIERDKKLLEILSGTIAVSLENARLYGELKDHLHALEREKRLLLSQAKSEAGYKEIIGSSAPMRRMFELMEKVIDTPTTVLIQGETGTGKELIARVIHYNGPLKDKAFIAENCAALSENLLESELFGHVRGAFTGAVVDKKGLFEIADGGTIFLDEIGDMSLPMQVKLLRVLQEGQLRPVGGHRTIQVNVRVIAATNRTLEEEITKGTFREDLYYRINVFQITPPPLRERKDDILFLANHFLEKFAHKHNKPVPHIIPQSIDLLTRYNWPGNVRELENEMERALAMAAGNKNISPEFLSDKISPPDLNYSIGEREALSPSLKDAVRQVETRMIMEALERTQGNRSQAAKALGLSRQGLLNKIAAYHVQK